MELASTACTENETCQQLTSATKLPASRSASWKTTRTMIRWSFQNLLCYKISMTNQWTWPFLDFHFYTLLPCSGVSEYADV